MSGQPVTTLPYATPGRGGGSPVAAGVWVMIGGLVLLFFGGCFCIGVLIQVNSYTMNGGSSPPPRMTWEQHLFMIALYGCATACFGAGAYVVWLGLRKLLAVGGR